MPNSKLFKRTGKKNKTKSRSKKHRKIRKNVRSIKNMSKKSKMSRMRGGYVSCNDRVITEPGFEIPVLGKAPGLSISESKIAMSSSNLQKTEHPMIK